jgi:predicted nucleic acid-binding protein
LSVFVDTSVWFGAANIRDRQNARAKKILAALTAPVLTDHVLIETWTLLNARVHRRAAEQFWMGVRRGAAHLERVLAADLDAAWAIGEAFPDQDFSIVDRSSFYGEQANRAVAAMAPAARIGRLLCVHAS